MRPPPDTSHPTPAPSRPARTHSSSYAPSTPMWPGHPSVPVPGKLPPSRPQGDSTPAPLPSPDTPPNYPHPRLPLADTAAAHKIPVPHHPSPPHLDWTSHKSSTPTPMPPPNSLKNHVSPYDRLVKVYAPQHPDRTPICQSGR